MNGNVNQLNLLPGLGSILRSSNVDPAVKVQAACMLMGGNTRVLANQLERTPQHLSMVLRGHRDSLALAIAISQILGVSPSDINPAWPDETPEQEEAA